MNKAHRREAARALLLAVGLVLLAVAASGCGLGPRATTSSTVAAPATPDALDAPGESGLAVPYLLKEARTLCAVSFEDRG